MKKIYIKQLLTAILLLCSTVVSAETYSGTCGTNVNWSLDTETGVLEITGTGAMDNVIYAPWNAYKDDIKYVSIGNGVTNIADDAFYYYESLTSITIPNSVTTIGNSAFECCDHLTSIEIPNSVTTIGERAFYNCSGLTSIEIPNSVTTIEENAFTSCDYLTSIIVESGNTKYDSRDNCNAIIETAINTLIAGCAYTIIPNSVTAIGDYAFASCSGLTSITIPNSVTTIGNYAFDYCSGLTSVTIGNSVTSIGQSAFEGCWGLTSVTIPNSVTTIGFCAFESCWGLTSVTIGNSVTTIGGSAFSECSGLTSVTIPNSVTTIGNSAFSYCSGLTSVTIPNSVTTIGNQAFDNCTSLTNIEIPNSVTTIGQYAFFGTAWYNNQPNGAIYAGKVFYEYKGIMDDTNIYIIEGTLGIADAALYGCTGLTSITIPNSVTTIGRSAFEGCTGLASISIPNSVTTIGFSAFRDCTGLASISIPNSVTTIGAGTFYGCTNLATVYNNSSLDIVAGATTHGYVAYYATEVITGNSSDFVFTTENGVHKLIEYTGSDTDITLPDDYNGESYEIAEGAFSNCTNITNITIPNNVTSIGESAFHGCTSLKSITIPNSVITIGDYAFNNCSSLANIEIPNSVTTIGNSAFYGCSGLTNVTIGNGVTTIGEAAFADCSNLTSIEIPNNVTTIGVAAFANCSSLANIEIPNSVTTIGVVAFSSTAWLENQPDGAVYAGKVFLEYKGAIPNNTTFTIKDGTLGIAEAAFLGDINLTSITIPNSIISIGGGAFYNCSGLAEIYSLAETPATIENDTFNDYSATLYVPAGAKAAYQAADYWKNFTNIVEMTPTEETPTEVTITIGQYGTATYCSPYALDFSEVEGLKAYTATGYNSSTGVVTLTRAQTAEDATGLFLMGEPGEYTVPVIEYSSDYMLNMLVGTLETTAVNNKTDDGNYINFKYTIGSESSQPMFYQFEDGSTLSAGKAYLQLPARLFTTTASKSISLRFDDGRLTDIDRVESESNDTQTIIYDLCGRRVSKPAKGGIYIKNGKKIIL